MSKAKAAVQDVFHYFLVATASMICVRGKRGWPYPSWLNVFHNIYLVTFFLF